MAFPTTGLLDNFNRADDLTPPPGANWTNTVVSGDVGMQLVGNALTFGSAALSSNYWNVSTFGPNCEVYAGTVATPPSANGAYLELFARVSNPGGGTLTGYSFRYTQAAASTWELNRWDNGAKTVIASGSTGAMAANDKLGLECTNSQISGYRFTGGSWAQKATVSDATYAGAGFIGLRVNDSAADGFEWDDFSGGSIAIISSAWLKA